MTRRIDAEFDVFYRQHKDACFRALLATVASSQEADDLLAEAFTRALARWSTVREHPAPAAWVVRTALNLHRDRWRQSRRAQRWLRRQRPGEAYVDVVDPQLLAAVRALPDRQREVIVFRVLLGQSEQDTAATLGIDAGTVGTHLRRALATLRVSNGVSLPNQPEPTTDRSPVRQAHHSLETTT